MSEINLPKGWCLTTIAHIAEVNPKKLDADPDTLSGFIPMSHAPTSYNGKLHYEVKPWDEIKKSYTNFKDGDVIVAKVTPCFENGKASIVSDLPNGIGAGSSEFYVIRPVSIEISTHFLFSIIKSQKFLQEGADNMTGAVGLRRVPRSFVENFPVSLPPSAEQKIIANKLDTLLTKVDKIKVHLERIPELLKAFRQSVLSAAVSGKLVSVNNPITVTVGEIATDIRYGTSKKCDYNGGQTPVIRIPNISDRKLNTSDLKYADFTEKELKTLALKAGDILVIRSNGSLDLVAKSALVEQKYEGFLYAGYLIRIRCNEKKILPSFLLNIMNSRVVRDVVEISSRSTSGVNNINSKELAALKFVLPSIEEQAEIVQYVEKLFDFADSIEQKANVALERVNNLTQSIFAKAFRGELTADWRTANPDLVSGENSAESLLEKIKAERKVMKPTKKTRTRKNV